MSGTLLKDRLITLACGLLAALFAAGRVLRRQTPGAPVHILVLKPCCLGDVLMTTPVLAVLRRSFPHACITYAVGAWSRQAVLGNPNIDDIIDCGKVGSGKYSLSEYITLSRSLRQHRFDLAIILDRSPALGLLAFLAGIPQRVGLDSGGRGFAHTVRVPVDWQHPKHEADLYLDCVRALGLPVVEPRLEYFPSTADRLAIADFGLPAVRPAVSGHPPPESRPFVAIHPGGAANPGMTLLAKRWQPVGFAAVADRLAEQYGVQIILVGAPSDVEAAEAVRQAMQHEPLMPAGKTTLGQLAALYEHCMLMVGNDSGVMHLAVAVGIPVVAVFGPSDDRVYGPYGPKGVAVRKDAQCFGRCFIPGRAIAVRCDRRCIESVTVESVWSAVQTLLSRTA